METIETVRSSVTSSETVTTTDGVEKKKKRRPEGKDGKKLRRRKRHDNEKENGGADQPGAASESSRIHVRSYDSSKVIKKFSKAPAEESQTDCRACGRQVFQMERIKAERAVWHKDCFRCTECSKQLTVDTYASHERQLYCKVHHKMLFKPKAVEEKEEQRAPRLRRHELIIRESQPQELPPDVVRSSNKSDYGLDELQNLNVKDRFSVFELTGSNEPERSASTIEVKPSQNLLKKIKKFQARGGGDQDIGVELEDMSSDEEEDEDDEDGVQRDPDVVRSASRKAKERPASFAAMDDTKRRFEEGHERRERLREERKGELTKLRGLICGASDRRKQYEETLTQAEKLKRTVEDPHAEIQNLNLKAYEEALKAAEESRLAAKAAEAAVTRERAADMASKWERGELSQAEEDEELKRRREEDAALFREAGTARGARSLFKELDASGAAKSQVVMRSPSSAGKTEFRKSLYESEPAQDVIKSSSRSKDIHVETSALSSKFKFFETYKEPEVQKKQFRFSPPREGTVKGDSPDREIARDPNVVRGDDPEDRLVRSDTTSRMLRQFQEMERQGGERKEIQRAEKPQGNARSLLSKFRQMEEDAQRQDLPDGPKPLKSFTPPPEYTEETDSDEYTYTDDSEYTSDEDSESAPPRAATRVQDEFLTQRTDHARNLKAKFERWEQKMEKERKFDDEDECRPSLETARNLRSMFEAMKDQPATPEKPRPKVNRFIGLPARRGQSVTDADADPEPGSDRRPEDSASASSFWDDEQGADQTRHPTDGDAGSGAGFWGNDTDDRDAPSSFWEKNDADDANTSTSFWDRDGDDDAGKKSTSFWDREEEPERAPVSFWDRNDNDATPETNPRSTTTSRAPEGSPRREDGRAGPGEDSADDEDEEDEESSEASEESGSEDGAPDARAVRRRPTDD